MKKSQAAKKIYLRVKSQVQKHLTQGKNKLVWLDRQISDEKNRQKLRAEFEKSKTMIGKLKKRFDHYEEKTVHYTEKNPKKALAIAVTAGILAGTLLRSFSKNKKTSARRDVPKRTTRSKG